MQFAIRHMSPSVRGLSPTEHFIGTQTLYQTAPAKGKGGEGVGKDEGMRETRGTRA